MRRPDPPQPRAASLALNKWAAGRVGAQAHKKQPDAQVVVLRRLVRMPVRRVIGCPKKQPDSLLDGPLWASAEFS
jgi:hypothetical protein